MTKLACAAALAVALATLGGCGDDASGPPGPNTVNVRDNSFNPSSLTVTTGTTVTWSWTGSAPHDVTWVDPGSPADSPTQTSGSYQRGFTTPGTFAYYCTVHGTPTSGMRGTVTVN